MPDLFEILGTTRSMRRLKPDPVPDEMIKEILLAGTSAANGGNNQTWRFLVVKDPAIKKAVQVWYKKAFDEVIGPRYATQAPPRGGISDGAFSRSPGLDRCLSGRWAKPGAHVRRLDLSRRAKHVAGDTSTRPWLDIDHATYAVRQGE